MGKVSAPSPKEPTPAQENDPRFLFHYAHESIARAISLDPLEYAGDVAVLSAIADDVRELIK